MFLFDQMHDLLILPATISISPFMFASASGALDNCRLGRVLQDASRASPTRKREVKKSVEPRTILQQDNMKAILRGRPI